MLVLWFIWLHEYSHAEVAGCRMEPKQNKEWVTNLISSDHKTRVLINLYNKYFLYRDIVDTWDFTIHFKELAIKFTLAQAGQGWISLRCASLPNSVY